MPKRPWEGLPPEDFLKYRDWGGAKVRQWFYEDPNLPDLTQKNLEEIKESAKKRFLLFLRPKIWSRTVSKEGKDTLDFKIDFEPLARTLDLSGVNAKQAIAIMDELLLSFSAFEKTERGYKVVNMDELAKIADYEPSKNKIVNLLNSEPNLKLTQKQISERTGIPEGTVRENLQILRKRGTVRLAGQVNLGKGHIANLYEISK